MAFKNVDLLASMIQEHDEPILEHLSNVKVDFSAEPMVSYHCCLSVRLIGQQLTIERL